MTAVFVTGADPTDVLVARRFRRTEARTPGRLTRGDAEAVR